MGIRTRILRAVHGGLIGLTASLLVLMAFDRAGGFFNGQPAAGPPVVGDIDEIFVSQFLSVAEPGGWVEVLSFGGQVNLANDLVDYISENGVKIRVSETCSSACIHLLLAADEVELEPDAMIGVHWTAYVRQDLLASRDYPSNACLDEMLDAERSLFVAQEMDPGRLGEEVIRRLNLRLTGYGQGEGRCWPMSFEADYEMWYLTAAEVEEYLGIPVDGRLCADSLPCIQRKLDRAQARSTRVLAGLHPIVVQKAEPIGDDWVYRRIDPGSLDGWFPAG